MIDSTRSPGTWDEQKGKLKKRFAVLTDNDLLLERGKQEETLRKLQIILGKTNEELLAILAAL